MPPKKRRLSYKSAEAVKVQQFRCSQTDTDRHARLDVQRQRCAHRLLLETDEQRLTRQATIAALTASARAQESPASTSSRQATDTARKSAIRHGESSQQQQERVQSVQRHQAQVRGFSRPTAVNWSFAALHYDVTNPYAEHPDIQIGRMCIECTHCGALKWPREAPGLCCLNGKIRLDNLTDTPQTLKNLLLGDSPNSKHFLENIRSYNTAFQMTSFGCGKREIHGPYMPTFKIQGQVYHRIGSLLPVEGQQPQFLQIYFMGNSDEEAQRRASIVSGIKLSILQPLQIMLHATHRYVQIFKTNLEQMNRGNQQENYKIVIRPEKAPTTEHRKNYCAPEVNEVAVLIVGQNEQVSSRDIVLETRNNGLKRVDEIHPWYDSLQYPLLFPFAEDGYGINLPQTKPPTQKSTSKKTSPKISSLSFYAYRIMARVHNFNRLLRCRMLFHQFVVDMYAKIETERLNFIKHNQKQLRAESYVHLKDTVDRQSAMNDGEQVNANDIGQAIILPSTFTGGPRYMQERTQDAMTYVRNHGRPDLFVTFTCNPTWDEVQTELFDGQKPEHRHDLLARVFHLKLKTLMDLISVGDIFGKVICQMYTIEWQKRGLPHAHILLWLQEKLRPTQVDDVISAEFPDPQKDPKLFSVVKKNMIHGPCGALNSQAKCMDKGKCTKRYPRQLIKDTKTGEDGYPLYRRRQPDDGGFTASIKQRNGQELQIDNSWVVPHCPLLSKIFSAHINVEYCNSVRAIKYICKYVNKGSDKAVFEVTEQSNQPGETLSRDEVMRYQTGRYISSNEAAWRLMQFPIHHRHPPVEHLSVHLENGQRVYFTQDNVEQRAEEPPKTTLTAFFDLCSKDNYARNLLYCDVPRFYRWDSSHKTWNRRKQGQPVPESPGMKSAPTLGRVYTVHPLNFECFCLRLLLHAVRGPTSFEDLRTVEGHLCDTFREACSMQGLLEDEAHWDKTLEDAAVSQSACMMRNLFAIMIVFCGLGNAAQLWEKHKESLSEDVLHQVHHHSGNHDLAFTDAVFNQALIQLEDKVIEMGGNPLTQYGLTPNRSQQLQLSRHMLRETSYDARELQQFVEHNEPMLTPDQAAAYNSVIATVESGDGGLYFLDAPGGTGKTFLLNLLLAKVRQTGEIALAVASSGIAATLLQGGRTAHSTFKLPLNLSSTENPTCNITKRNDEGHVLRRSALIVWDECTMAHKKDLEALDRTMRDLRDSTKLFGGVTLLLAGDFRQTLPIIARGTPADELDACLKSSHLWPHFHTLCLSTNMRVQLQADQTSEAFAKNLLHIGNGTIQSDKNRQVDIRSFSQHVTQNELIANVYPDLQTSYRDAQWLCDRAILAPKNVTVNHINHELMQQLPGDPVYYKSIDLVVDQQEATQYPTEFLNSLEPPGMPSHNLALKIGCPVMLLRNLDAPRLCNGTRLIVKDLKTNVVHATIITGQAKGQEVLIPRIPLIPSDLPFVFRRLQFPLRTSFAMTINKAQGQSLKVAGLYLAAESQCFAHGQLYVGCSRVGQQGNLFVHTPDGKATNIVYPAALL